MMLDLGFVAFSAFRATANETVAAISTADGLQVWNELPEGIRVQWRADNAQQVWNELPEEIRAQWEAAATAVEELCAYGPISDKHEWPLSDACVFGPWQLHAGMPTPRKYRTCIHPRCVEVEYKDVPVT